MPLSAPHLQSDLTAVAAHFDKRAAQYRAKYVSAQPRHLYEHEKHERLRYALNWIAAHARSNPHGHLLDVGCGNGTMICNALSGQPGWRATGIDVSAEMLSRAEQASDLAGCGDRVTWQIGSVRERPATFDVVTSLGVVGYQSDQAEFLRSLATRVRAGGLLIFTFANAHSFPRRVRTIAQWLHRIPQWNTGAVRFRSLTATAVARSMANAGLRHVATQRLCYGLGLPRSTWEVELSRWCEENLQNALVAGFIAQVLLVCYQRPVVEAACAMLNG